MVKELEAFHPQGLLWRSFRGSTGTPPVETRDPIYWPYPADSIWNMPIGTSADLIPLGFNYGGDGPSAAGRIAIAEENILVLDPDAPKAYVMEHDAGWTGASRCGSRTGAILTGNGSVSPMPKLPIPPGFTTEANPPYIGTNPNMSGAFIYRDGTDLKLFETQPLHFCLDGVAVSQSVRTDYVGDSLKFGGHGPPPSGSTVGTGGSHGGSRMTAFGGTIRLGELVPGGLIPHALKLTLDTGWYCSASGSAGHRWPALVADSGWATNYGSNNPSCPPQAKMGMLLTVPNSFDPEALVTEPARIIARAFKKYGAYVVDGDFGAPVPWICQWQLERSNEGAQVVEFKDAWGYEFFHKPAQHGTPSSAQMQWRTDLGNLMEAACIVNDNAYNNVGGTGVVRRAPLAPPLEA